MISREYEIHYFKASGKWYASAKVKLDGEHMNEVAESFKAIQATENAPGLSTGGFDFNVVILPDKDHIYGYPWMIPAER